MKHLVRKYMLLGMVAAFFAGMPAAGAAPVVPENIFQWVQSTSRADYYFNKQQICFAVDKEGYLELNRLLVPILKVYDPVQIEDVVAKRRWRMQNMTGYEMLAGAAEYLEFDLDGKTVKVRWHDDLDDTWTVLGTERAYEPMRLDSYGPKDVDGKFYKAILEYAADHREEIIEHSEGKLREEVRKKLEEAKKSSQDGKDGDKGKKDKEKKEKKDKKSKKDRKQ